MLDVYTYQIKTKDGQFVSRVSYGELQTGYIKGIKNFKTAGDALTYNESYLSDFDTSIIKVGWELNDDIQAFGTQRAGYIVTFRSGENENAVFKYSKKGSIRGLPFFKDDVDRTKLKEWRRIYRYEEEAKDALRQIRGLALDEDTRFTPGVFGWSKDISEYEFDVSKVILTEDTVIDEKILRDLM